MNFNIDHLFIKLSFEGLNILVSVMLLSILRGCWAKLVDMLWNDGCSS